MAHITILHHQNKNLAVFRAIAQLKSFTKAANQLEVTQPAISFSIKALEHDLGVALFYRDKKTNALAGIGSAALTEKGEKIYALAKQIADLEQEILCIARDEEHQTEDKSDVALAEKIQAVLNHWQLS